MKAWSAPSTSFRIFPFAAAERAELRGSPRIHPYRSHIIVYRLDGRDILIQRVRHASEDWLGRP